MTEFALTLSMTACMLNGLVLVKALRMRLWFGACLAGLATSWCGLVSAVTWLHG